MTRSRDGRDGRRPRKPSATRVLASQDIPLPPPPEVEIGVLGADAAAGAALLGPFSPLPLRVLDLDACDAPIAALLVDGDRDPRAVTAIDGLRRAGDDIPAVVFGEREETSHGALWAGAFFVQGTPHPQDLAQVARLARRHAMAAPVHRRRWARDRLAPWIVAALAPYGLTPRNAEIVAHGALGHRRAGIATELDISLKRVDEHIAKILDQTRQHRLDDVSRPFAKRIEELRRATLAPASPAA